MWLDAPYRQILIGVFVFLLFGLISFIQRRYLRDPVVAFERDDPELLAAAAKAQSSAGSFWVALENPSEETTDFAVKIRIEEGGNAEHVWLFVDRDARKSGRGRLGNRPQVLRLKAGDMVDFSENQITDWAYYESGRLVGGESIRLMLTKLPPAEAAEVAKQMGVNC